MKIDCQKMNALVSVGLKMNMANPLDLEFTPIIYQKNTMENINGSLMTMFTKML